MSAVYKLGSVLGALVGATTFAFAEDVDWKMYGAAGAVNAPSLCFFDAKSVSQTNDGHVRVWMKCLPQKDLDDVDLESDRGHKLLDKAGDKLNQGYVPPIVQIGRIEFDRLENVIMYEETANIGDIDPSSRMLLELNCSEKMDRRLSTYLKGMGFQDKPSAWQHIPPETNPAYLQKILCPSH